MIETVCQECGRQYIYNKKDKKGHTKTVCNSCKVNNRRHFVMQRAIEYKGGACQLCGYNKCPRALNFHHRNPSEKSFIIGGNFCRKWETIQHELDKCDLLCANCHAELHYKDDNARYKKWSPKVFPILNKTCPYCKNDFIANKKKQVYCSQKCGRDARYQYQKPSREDLIESIKVLKNNMSAIGRKYGVSDNAIRKWIKWYGI